MNPEVGEACDAEFGYRLAELGDFFFVGKYTYAYRVTDESISSGGLRIALSKQYFLLRTGRSRATWRTCAAPCYGHWPRLPSTDVC